MILSSGIDSIEGTMCGANLFKAGAMSPVPWFRVPAPVHGSEELCESTFSF